MTGLIQLDRTVFVWINTGWSNPVLDVIMPWVTYLGAPAMAWVWIGLMGVLMGRQLARSGENDRDREHHTTIVRAVVFSCLCLALIYGVSAGVYNGLKYLVDRSRPFLDQTIPVRILLVGPSGIPRDSSFPSGHACNAFMVAALFAYRFRRQGYLFYGLAGLVALSRVYLGVHYPGDVLAGAALGLSITWVMLTLRPLRRRIEQENLPSPTGLSRATQRGPFTDLNKP